MPDGPGHAHDVFVSYAHADNEKPLSSVAQYGWVTTLAHNLNTGPGHYHKNLFIDHQLMPGDAPLTKSGAGSDRASRLAR